MVLLADWLPGMSDKTSTWSDICLVIIKNYNHPCIRDVTVPTVCAEASAANVIGKVGLK